MAEVKVNVFFSYSHEDEKLRDELAKHLKPLERQGKIESWHDRKIYPGTDWRQELSTQLDLADIILLLISSSFISSDFCYCTELQYAKERHKEGSARIIPIFLRPIDPEALEGTPIEMLQGLPEPSKPITSSEWSSQDDAFVFVAKAIRKVVVEVQKDKKDKLTIQEDDMSSERGIDCTQLRFFLKERDWVNADYETYQKMLGAMKKKGWQDVAERDFLNFPCEDLETISRLWRKYSEDECFGFDAQKDVYVKLCGTLDLKNLEDCVWHKFAEEVQWRNKRTGEWIETRKNIVYNLSAPKGHIPWIGHFFGGSTIDSKNMFHYLMIRLEECKMQS